MSAVDGQPVTAAAATSAATVAVVGPGDAAAGRRKWFSGTATKDRLRDLACGIQAGFICKTVEYPFDTLKVIMQVRSEALIVRRRDATARSE
jgi:hypothetical protein